MVSCALIVSNCYLICIRYWLGLKHQSNREDATGNKYFSKPETSSRQVFQSGLNEKVPYGHLSLKIHHVEFDIYVPLVKLYVDTLCQNLKMSPYHCVQMSIRR